MEVTPTNVLKGQLMNPLATGMASAMFGLVLLGGVPIEANHNNIPAEPTLESEPYLWPTDKVYYGQSIRMADGSVWRVKMSRTKASGDIEISLRRNATTQNVSPILVPAEHVHTRIWWATDLFVPDPEGGQESLPWQPAPEIPEPENPGQLPPPVDPTPTPTDPPEGS